MEASCGVRPAVTGPFRRLAPSPRMGLRVHRLFADHRPVGRSLAGPVTGVRVLAATRVAAAAGWVAAAALAFSMGLVVAFSGSSVADQWGTTRSGQPTHPTPSRLRPPVSGLPVLSRDRTSHPLASALAHRSAGSFGRTGGGRDTPAGGDPRASMPGTPSPLFPGFALTTDTAPFEPSVQLPVGVGQSQAPLRNHHGHVGRGIRSAGGGYPSTHRRMR